MVNLVTSGAHSFTDPDLACSDLIYNSTLWNNNAETLCHMVNATESCLFNDGHIEYILGMYCVFKDVVPLGITLMFLWLILMLIGLATTADVFFGPCLIVMADTLKLSQNVAGVTLLALGNGAPDIFSAISSITTLKDGDAGLAFGALLGAGMFVTAVTSGAIALVKPFTAMSRPLLKDIVFYLFTIFWAFVIMFKQTITLIDSIGFIVLYVVYVIMTVLSRGLYSKGIGSGSKQQGPNADQEKDGNSIPLGTIKLRTDTDIRPNLTDAFAQDNPGYSPGTAGPSSRPPGGYLENQRRSDAEAGYDTSLDFPGGLRRVEAGAEAETEEVKKTRSRRFQELDVNSSPKTSQARKPSRMDERMKRVSRVQMQKISRTHPSPKVSSAGMDNYVSGHKTSVTRKTSTASFTGVERRANYLTRWMLVYGNLENVEHRSRSASVTSDQDDAGPRSRSNSNSRSRSSSVTKRQQQQQREQRNPDTSRPGTSGASSLSAPVERPGYKLSGGLGMGAASAYFQRKEQEQQNRKQQEQQQQPQQQQTKKISQPRQQLQSQQQQQEDDDIHQRHLYRIESVDEALDDDTVDRLNKLNEMRMLEEKEMQRADRDETEAEQKEEAAEQPAEEEAEDQSPIKEFLYSLVPVDMEEFPEMTWYNKVYEIIKAPILFLLLLSTPCVDYDQPLNGWSRILNSVHCAVAPVFIAIAFKGYQWAIPIAGGGSFPVVLIVLAVGLILGVLVYCTSSDFEPPRYHAAFAFIGFLTAIVWIYTFANEVVNMLESVGIIFRISSTILGLTVLAWANSIGDVISNTVLARQNFPRVAISACFGGPLFNLLLGVGIPFTIRLLSGSEPSNTMQIKVTLVQLVLVASVSISLIMSMVYLTLFRYKVGRVYGIMLIVLYLVFLVIALLAESGQFPLNL